MIGDVIRDTGLWFAGTGKAEIKGWFSFGKELKSNVDTEVILNVHVVPDADSGFRPAFALLCAVGAAAAPSLEWRAGPRTTGVWGSVAHPSLVAPRNKQPQTISPQNRKGHLRWNMGRGTPSFFMFRMRISKVSGEIFLRVVGKKTEARTVMRVSARYRSASTSSATVIRGWGAVLVCFLHADLLLFLSACAPFVCLKVFPFVCLEVCSFLTPCRWPRGCLAAMAQRGASSDVRSRLGHLAAGVPFPTGPL